MIRLIVPKPWRHRDARRGVQVLPAGEYSVPDQVPQELADRAIAEGMATAYRIRLPESVTVQGPSSVVAPENVRRKRGRKAKGPSPENRSLGAAPENKSPFH